MLNKITFIVSASILNSSGRRDVYFQSFFALFSSLKPRQTENNIAPFLSVTIYFIVGHDSLSRLLNGCVKLIKKTFVISAANFLPDKLN